MMLSKQINLSQQMFEVFFVFFKNSNSKTHLLCLIPQPKHLTKLTSSCQSSTPKSGLPQYLSRGPPRHPAEPRGPQTPPRPGPYPRLEVQQRPSKSLRLKGRGSKPQTALHHFLHHLSRARFRLWFREEPRTGSVTFPSGWKEDATAGKWLEQQSLDGLKLHKSSLFFIEQFV